MFLKKNIPTLYAALGVYLPLITTNCAVLGVALLNTQMCIRDRAGTDASAPEGVHRFDGHHDACGR